LVVKLRDGPPGAPPGGKLPNDADQSRTDDSALV